ncbi:MAG: tyrosine protein phosphatase [Parvibaculaceae bacterium]|nr:tyrosine protein phosphatase [Parvibaculaceae bacterium]
MIYVSPLSAVEKAVETLKPSHVISLLDANSMIPTPEGIAPDRHLRLGINDIHAPADDLVCPEQAHVEELISFVRGWDRSAPMLVHCWAGISRSTSSAYVALCALNEPGTEMAFARLLRQRGPHANPNPRIVALGDALLGRDGRMIEAIAAIGPASAAWEGNLYALPVTLAP